MTFIAGSRRGVAVRPRGGRASDARRGATNKTSRRPRGPGLRYNRRASYDRPTTYDDVSRIAARLDAAAVTVRDTRDIWLAEEKTHPLFGDDWMTHIDWYQYVRYVRHRALGRLILGHERRRGFTFDLVVLLRPDTLLPVPWLWCAVNAARDRRAVVKDQDSVWIASRDVGSLVLEFVPNATNYPLTSIPSTAAMEIENRAPASA